MCLCVWGGRAVPGYGQDSDCYRCFLLDQSIIRDSEGEEVSILVARPTHVLECVGALSQRREWHRELFQ